MQKEKNAETTGEDNLKTVQLVFSAYESAKTNSVIEVKDLTDMIQSSVKNEVKSLSKREKLKTGPRGGERQENK